MCCWTHGDLEAYPGPLAASDDWRCRCGCSPPCPRKATREDLLCDHCRGPSQPPPVRPFPGGLEEFYGAPGDMRLGEYRRLLREAGPPEPEWYESARDQARYIEQEIQRGIEQAYGSRPGPASFTFRLPVSQSAAQAVARHAAGEPGLRFPPPAPPLAG